MKIEDLAEVLAADPRVVGESDVTQAEMETYLIEALDGIVAGGGENLTELFGEEQIATLEPSAALQERLREQVVEQFEGAPGRTA